ncbi:sugar ABC transporter permease [Vallitalea pronyensis]|uniref:Sugar ABC transporter permease n=1 Tax=Vallitalea pronyensis TaxID=1348613 RepID=A0A8J8SGX7_9FIRM|nr:sugar ABC transporter permease [Vallitalea pronyensis]QUI22783.1 sugar ABC transporter permease [Vallitalea pronyensis]
MTFKRKKVRDHENLVGYICIAPWLIGFFIFTLMPILTSFYFSFTKYDVISMPEWHGLANYKDIFLTDARFLKSLLVTFKYVFLSVPFRLAFALFVAVLFAQKRKMVGLYRTLFYIPSIIGGSVAVAVMWRQLFGVEGALNAILIKLGLLDNPSSWIGNPKTALWTLIILAAWQFGSPMLIFLAGLKQIPKSFYEAASIDGANRFQQFWRITIPSLTPVIFFNFIMQTISGFMTFTQSYIITEGGPFDSTLLYAQYLFEKAFRFYKMGYGSALAWILLLIIAVFTSLIFKSSSYWVFYESKEN